MSSIAVVHDRFDIGGAEAVCFAVLDALQKEHDLHLYALECPNFEELNATFGTSVSNVSVHVPDKLVSIYDSCIKSLNKLTGGFFGGQIPTEWALLSRRFRDEWNKHDLRISTRGEYPFSEPGIQYIHHPILNVGKTDDGVFSANGLYSLYNRICTRIAGSVPSAVRRSVLLTNSEWTAEQIEPVYGTRPRVVYPPIATNEFSPRPWLEQENGIVWIGRIESDKNPLQALKIFEQLQGQESNNLHIHMIGPQGKSKYTKQVCQRAELLDSVHLEGAISRKKLVDLVESHRWALHTKPYEHFGMVVAEFVAGGCVPFVPASGGQVEIINRQDVLCYTSTEDAVMKIKSLLEPGRRPDEILDNLSNASERFGHDRFQREIRSYVESDLE